MSKKLLDRTADCPYGHGQPTRGHGLKLALSITEVCEALGVSRPTVYRLMDSGQLATFTVGRRRLIQVSELERFVAERVAA
jgi:excisionase family DNA binding protein